MKMFLFFQFYFINFIKKVVHVREHLFEKMNRKFYLLNVFFKNTSLKILYLD